MKTSFKIIFSVGALCMLLLTNCRTGDDGTNNHGKATEGIKYRMLNKDNDETVNDEPMEMDGTVTDSSGQAPLN